MVIETARVENPEELQFEPLGNCLRTRAPTPQELARYQSSGLYRYDMSRDDEITRAVGIRVDVRELRRIAEPRLIWVKRNPDGPVLTIASRDAKGICGLPENCRLVPENIDYSEIGLIIYDVQPNRYGVKLRAGK